MNELTFYQNVYKTKSGAIVIYLSLHDSIESAIESAKNQGHGDTYVGTILVRATNLLK